MESQDLKCRSRRTVRERLATTQEQMVELWLPNRNVYQFSASVHRSEVLLRCPRVKEYHLDIQPFTIPGGDGESDKFYVLYMEANRLYLISERDVMLLDVPFETEELLYA